MEKLKKKHDHKATKALQVVIFFIMMLAPFLAIGVKCAYAIFNQNAKDSYFGENINIKELVNVDTINNNDDYIVKPMVLTTMQGQNNINFSCSSKSVVIYGNNTLNFNNGFVYYHDNNSRNYYALRMDTGEYTYISCSQFTNMEIYEFYTTASNKDLIKSQFYKYVYNNESYIDNVFYYAIDQVKESPLFNWTESTAIYSGINTMLTGLEIGTGTTTLAILLTYWALMTAIYIVFDIIIFCFTKLTHLIQ